ncbi:hypothetical protein [Leucobacter tenebrionis]|uniref:hypothetical protein n=1 Tax=Leucobacter tenebrionis TaxID=2873270 RepID=UPI001CA6EEA7|nr:hypothetical protein [Leucobacter tenebrionis]QZY51785.1 hypothetical protein KVY00_14705 [Leucobacter tenebrionis]
MDDLIELVSPEQLPAETESATRFLLESTVVEVEPEGAHSWWFPELGVSLVQRDLRADGAFVVSGHGDAGSFAEALAVLREIAQDPPGMEGASGGGTGASSGPGSSAGSASGPEPGSAAGSSAGQGHASGPGSSAGQDEGSTS